MQQTIAPGVVAMCIDLVASLTSLDAIDLDFVRRRAFAIGASMAAAGPVLLARGEQLAGSYAPVLLAAAVLPLALAAGVRQTTRDPADDVIGGVSSDADRALATFRGYRCGRTSAPPLTWRSIVRSRGLGPRGHPFPDMWSGRYTCDGGAFSALRSSQAT